MTIINIIVGGRRFLLLLVLASIAPQIFALTTPIDVSGYQNVLIPSGHGLITYTSTYSTRTYPSRLQNMQFMLFYNPSSNSALYVQTSDSSANISKWQLSNINGKNTLTVTQYKTSAVAPTSEPLTIDPAKPWIAAAERYKQWAFNQSWAKQKNSKFDSVKIVATGASPYFSWLREYLNIFLAPFSDSHTNAGNPATATWLTLWRADAFDSHDFDAGFPRYTPATPVTGPSEQISFAALLKWVDSKNSIAMPYINANLWDNRITDPDGIPSHNYNANNTSAYNMSMDSQGNIRKYDSINKPWLEYVDPSTPSWKEIILQARGGLLDSNATPKLSAGVYYDVLASAEPSLCYNQSHTHGAGNPQIWPETFHWILSPSQTSGVIMVEGFAENYVDVVDVFLMHDSEAPFNSDPSHIPNKVPLWNAVYGTISRSAGWMVDTVGQTSSSTLQELKTARSFGSRTWGSPWYQNTYDSTHNTLTYQQNLLSTSDTAPPKYASVLSMISAPAQILEDGTSGISNWYASGHIQSAYDSDYGKNVIVKTGGEASDFTKYEWTAYNGYTNARWSIKRTNPNGMMSGFKVKTVESSGNPSKTVYLYYTSSSVASAPTSNFDGTSYYIYHGIGIAPSANGWQVIDRDLEADLRDVLPTETINQVRQFVMFYANGSVTDIKLFPRIK